MASDCSDDGTDEIVRGFAYRGVILSRQNARDGKTRAQQRAALVSNGEVLVFSDATTRLEPDTLRKLTRAFADPSVGCVAGRLVYNSGRSPAVSEGCRSYWDYESLLKSWESDAESLVGVSGCLYAVRRSCYAKLANDMINDFAIAIEMQLHGLRTVYEPEAVCSESADNRSRDEFRMRVRVIEQTMNALHRYGPLLDARKHGMFMFQIFCHKTLRYSTPVPLALAFIANSLALGAGHFYQYAFFAQLLFYFAAFVGWIGDRSGVKLGPLALPLLLRPGQRGVAGSLLEIHARRAPCRLGASARLAPSRACRRIEDRGLRIEDRGSNGRLYPLSSILDLRTLRLCVVLQEQLGQPRR